MRVWPEATVVHDARCGETHFLHPPLTDLFEALRHEPSASEVLFEFLQQRYDATTGELEEAIRIGLNQLRQYHLIQEVAESREI